VSRHADAEIAVVDSLKLWALSLSLCLYLKDLDNSLSCRVITGYIGVVVVVVVVVVVEFIQLCGHKTR